MHQKGQPKEGFMYISAIYYAPMCTEAQDWESKWEVAPETDLGNEQGTLGMGKEPWEWAKLKEAHTMSSLMALCAPGLWCLLGLLC